MANVKISQLPAVTVPLAGTEELPVVQGGVTKRTAINNILNANTIPYIANGLGAVATPSYTFTGDLNTGMWSPAADTIAFSEGGVEAMRITSAGNVGIGTTAPAVKLDVNGNMNVRNIQTGFGLTSGEVANISLGSGRSGDGDTSIGFYYTALAGQADAFLGCAVDGASATLQFNFGNNSANGDINFSTAAGTGAVITRTNGSERMRVTSAGNVGIGTSAPGAKLDVVGVSLVRETASTGGSPLTVRNDSSANNTTKTTGLLFQGTDTTSAGKNVGLVQCGPSDANYVTSYLAFQTRAADTLGERMRIDSSGNVGIGTSSPSTYGKFVVAGTGNVISSVVGDATGEGQIVYNNVTAGRVTVAGAFPLIFQTNSNERMRILSTGGITSSDLADAVGYKGLPQNAKTASYTLALSDMGKHISITTGGVVIPPNSGAGSVAFPIGSTIVIYNDSASAQNISITTDTLRLAGTATTGTRSLAQRGLATCVKVLATEWVVSGNVT